MKVRIMGREPIEIEVEEVQMVIALLDDNGNPLVGIDYDPDAGTYSLGYWDQPPLEGEWNPAIRVSFGAIVESLSPHHWGVTR